MRRIGQKVAQGNYVLTYHVINDKLPLLGLEQEDLVQAIQKGRIERREKDTYNNTVFHVVGPAADGRLIEIPRRFTGDAKIILITVYEA